MQRYKPSIIVPPTVEPPINGELPEVFVDETVVVWDGGNGISSVWTIQNGRLVHSSIPNVRAMATGFKFNSGVTVGKQADVIYADVVDGRYAFGDDCWNVTEHPAESSIGGDERYGSPTHIFFLLCLLAICEAPEDIPLTIVTSAPPSLVNKVAKQIKQGLRYGQSGDKDGLWEIKMSWDKNREPRRYIIGKVVVVPEGYGAWSAYASDVNGEAIKLPYRHPGGSALAGRVELHDAGMGTYDVYAFIDGVVQPESVERATDPEGGVLRLVIEPVIDYIRDQFTKKGDSAPVLRPFQVDYWLRSWNALSKSKKDGEFTVTIKGHNMNLSPIFGIITERYSRYVRENHISRSWQNGSNAIALSGGGFEYSLPSILKAYPKRDIYHPGGVLHLKDIPIWELNSYGGIPMIAANQRFS